MDFKITTSTLPQEITLEEWVLYSLQFKDLVLITAEVLNDILIDSNYQEISVNKSKRSISIMHITLQDSWT